MIDGKKFTEICEILEDKTILLMAISKILYDHPLWFEDIIKVGQQATIQVISDDRDRHSERRTKAENALSTLYPYAVGKEIRRGRTWEHFKQFAKDVLLVSSEGTKFGEDLKAGKYD